MKSDRTWPRLLLPLLLLRAEACREFDGGMEMSNAGAAGDVGDNLAAAGGGAATLGLGSNAGEESAESGADGAGVGGTREGVGPAPEAGADGAEGGAGGGAPELSPLEPAAFAGLALWLEASPEFCSPHGEGEQPAITPAKNLDRVLSCQDTSGHDNHARALDPAHGPLFVLKAVNGHAALRFDREPSLLTIEDSDSIRFGAGPFAILIVMRWSNSVEYLPPEYNDGTTYVGCGVLLSKVGIYQPFDGLAIFANFPGPFPGRPALPRLAVQLQYANALFLSYSSRLNDNEYRLYVVRRPVAGLGQIRINGESEGEAQIPLELDVSASGQPLTLGGGGASPFRGELAEFIAIAGAVDDGELERLERHLIQKYALSPASRMQGGR